MLSKLQDWANANDGWIGLLGFVLAAMAPVALVAVARLLCPHTACRRRHAADEPGSGKLWHAAQPA